MVEIKNLPEKYLENMRSLLGNGYESFLSAYGNAPARGLRFNKLKAREETVKKLKEAWRLKEVPWCEGGFYYDDALRPGLSPYHDAGVFYIQEPSAMYPAKMAEIKEESVILDLCAAPGGKSGQLAERCGILVANEPVYGRARILSSNMERLGVKNSIVTCAFPKDLRTVFKGFFDTILADAPCSGEGMMRRDETAIREWNPGNVFACAKRQEEILEEAYIMLKPGGSLIYSTCTFERAENEEQADAFLRRHIDMGLISMERLMPHMERCEGHFCAVFLKEGAGKASESNLPAVKKLLLKSHIPVLRCGVEEGEIKKGRKGGTVYTPSHAEAMASDFSEDGGLKINITDEGMALRYLSGEALNLPSCGNQCFQMYEGKEPAGLLDSRGWMRVYFDGYPLGNGKLVDGVVKNHYPKGLRRLKTAGPA